jgi:hypothetical protein
MLSPTPKMLAISPPDFSVCNERQSHTIVSEESQKANLLPSPKVKLG